MANKKWQSHPVILMAVAMNVFLLALALAWSGPDAKPLWRLLGEDGIVEWLQFLCFTVIAGMLAFVFAERRHDPATSAFALLVLAGLSALVALAALEEISWFQRVLKVASPEFFVENNRQAETNLHNLAMGSGSLHKTVLLKLILIAGLTHNLVLPFLARSRPALRHWIERMGLYLPPLGASIVYVVLVALSHLLIEHPRKGELGETFGAVHYLATVFYAYFAGFGYDKPALFEHGATGRRVAILFAMAMGFLLLVAWLLSAGAGAAGA